MTNTSAILKQLILYKVYVEPIDLSNKSCSQIFFFIIIIITFFYRESLTMSYVLLPYIRGRFFAVQSVGGGAAPCTIN